MSQSRVPVGKNTLKSNFERFSRRKLFFRQRSVARIEVWMALVVPIQCRRRRVIATPPNLDLRFAEFLSCLGFIQSLQCAVVTLVELPGVRDRNPFEVHFL